MFVSRAVNRIKDAFERKVRIALGSDLKYEIDDVVISLPPYHVLPSYLKRFKDYDRFLPHLVKYLASDSVVIDVGANCGDTFFAMVACNKDLQYVCIEADDAFFDYLKKNLRKIQNHHPSVRCHCVKTFVGKNINKVTLEGVGGTKHAVITDGEIGLQCQRLDVVLSDYNPNDISLIKIDVDGYDYDVINSAENVLSVGNVILYYECYYENSTQLNGYIENLNFLIQIGYSNFTLFDNYGCLIISSNDVNVVLHLINYVWKQNTKGANRTIHYFDILAYKNSHKELLDRVIDEY